MSSSESHSVPRMPSFDELLNEGATAPIDGWDFSWFAGRATEARPPWGYQRLVAGYIARSPDVLDLQTGGGEVLAGALRLAEEGTVPEAVTERESRPHLSPRVLATEGWEPNVAIARAALSPWSATVLPTDLAGDDIPLPDASVSLICARHPVTTPWAQIARVLAPGGTFVSQQIGRGTARELTEAMIGPFNVGEARLVATHVAAAEKEGLVVERVEECSAPLWFRDIAAVVAFLRKVVWTVPGFSVDKYRPQLEVLHEKMEREGGFRATSERFLIVCRKPG